MAAGGRQTPRDTSEKPVGPRIAEVQASALNGATSGLVPANRPSGLWNQSHTCNVTSLPCQKENADPVSEFVVGQLLLVSRLERTVEEVAGRSELTVGRPWKWRLLRLLGKHRLERAQLRSVRGGDVDEDRWLPGVEVGDRGIEVVPPCPGSSA